MFTPVQKTDAADFYFYGGIGTGFGIGSNPFEINSSESSYLPSVNLDANLGICFNENNCLDSKIGFRLSLIYSGNMVNQSDVNSIHYNGPENRSISPGAYAKVAIFPFNETVVHNGIFTEYNVSSQQIWLDNCNPPPKLADILNHTIKAGWEMKGKGNNTELTSDIFAGVSLPQIIQETSYGSNNKFNIKPDFFIGYSINFNFVSK